ncbi:MAG: hypothetical protein IPM79_25685 [Polyangiaceae bacterium]|nr:hypothetical protein [Polyangiaceae bacterium]
MGAPRWLLSVLLLAAGCGEHPQAPLGASSLVAAPSAPSAPPSMPASAPLTAAAPAKPPVIAGERFVRLAVPGFGDAVVAVPVGARGPRPIVLATHGNYDRPEWQCEVWGEIVETRAFVLCPRGDARPDSPSKDDVRFTYRSNQDLEKEVDAALAALRGSTYSPHLAAGPPVWSGFSLGAIMGVAIAARRPADFPILVLVEGGIDRFTEEVATKFARGGGRAVLFACAQGGCKAPASKRAARLEALGVRAMVVDAGNIGHAYDGPVAAAVKGALADLLRSDARFAEPQEPPP